MSGVSAEYSVMEANFVSIDRSAKYFTSRSFEVVVAFVLENVD
jgi:hypothetical protein